MKAITFLDSKLVDKGKKGPPTSSEKRSKNMTNQKNKGYLKTKKQRWKNGGYFWWNHSEQREREEEAPAQQEEGPLTPAQEEDKLQQLSGGVWKRGGEVVRGEPGRGEQEGGGEPGGGGQEGGGEPGGGGGGGVFRERWIRPFYWLCTKLFLLVANSYSSLDV